MNNEVKEILDNLKYCKEHDEENNYYPEDIFSKDEPYILLDYITNLQKYYDENVNKYEKLLVNYSRLQKLIDKVIEYIENDMPYLEEPDDDYENNHEMIEYDRSILLGILKGEK